MMHACVTPGTTGENQTVLPGEDQWLPVLQNIVSQNHVVLVNMYYNITVAVSNQILTGCQVSGRWCCIHRSG